MSTCGALATRLDEEMLLARSAIIYPPYTAVSAMPARSGSEVATELGGRYLLRYLTRALDPNQIPEVRGPRRVRLGGGLEYVLPKGFPASALVLPWPIPVV